MNAKEMFKEVGYEKTEKSESVVLYTNGYGDTISFKDTKHIVITPTQVCGKIIMTCLLENAIHKQCEELGWIEKEERVETNYEHYKDGIIELCVDDLAISKGKVFECDAIPCSECDFEDKNGHCIGNREIMKWLKQPYIKPVYKLTKFEIDLLQSYPDTNSFKLFNSLNRMKEKGYFKGIDENEAVGDILAKCEVVG